MSKIKNYCQFDKRLRRIKNFPQKVSHFGKIKKINRQKVLRKPNDFQPAYPGHLMALDTIEKFINGTKRYIITFEDIYSRFSFAWATKSHASLAAKEFFDKCQKIFPYPFQFQHVLTDNGSKFKKCFDEELRRLHMIHYHTCPKMPKMNAHLERFNRTIQDEFVDYYQYLLSEPDEFNNKLIDYLIFYNTERVHCAFQNKLSPIQFMMTFQPRSFPIKIPQECKIGLHYTMFLK